jgi:hypothetical protein
MRSLALAKIEHAREPWLSWAEVSAENWWCASIPAKELPVGQAVPRRLVNVRIPRILIRMQERAEEVPRSQRR